MSGVGLIIITFLGIQGTVLFGLGLLMLGLVIIIIIIGLVYVHFHCFYSILILNYLAFVASDFETGMA